MPRRTFHYAWIIALVTFIVLLVTAGIRATPGVLIVSLEQEFGWSRTVISLAVAINIALFGLIGPFAASVMERWGLRRVILAAAALLAVSVALTTQMRNRWELTLLWGVLVGTGTGVTSLVLAAVVANRWFDERRGLVVGVLSAANATGQLVFLPFLAAVVAQRGWRAAALVMAGASAVVFAIVLVFMRDRPEDLGLLPYGRRPASGPATGPRPLAPLQALGYAMRTRAFWLLAGTFFICGASTNGLIGTHLIAACHDYGIPELRSAQLLAIMGVFDILGTTASGWLTDRYSSRHLLFSYYTLRGLSLLYLPFTLQDGAHGLAWFAIFYGLDWVATVPPTVRLTSEAFGRENTGVIYGWIGASHQLGASAAAFSAGAIRTFSGDYQLAFWIAGVLCLAAGASFLMLGRRTFGVHATKALAYS
ncbi:MAG TPA: MFS transporter [Vicinamibacterales bacterium]|jgi:sugar phosphate permease|nr:MFS transporter [Vicinamibacterales bacterium]